MQSLSFQLDFLNRRNTFFLGSSVISSPSWGNPRMWCTSCKVIFSLFPLMLNSSFSRSYASTISLHKFLLILSSMVSCKVIFSLFHYNFFPNPTASLASCCGAVKFGIMPTSNNCEHFCVPWKKQVLNTRRINFSTICNSNSIVTAHDAYINLFAF
jgi:hypothetical protein